MPHRDTPVSSSAANAVLVGANLFPAREPPFPVLGVCSRRLLLCLSLDRGTWKPPPFKFFSLLLFHLSIPMEILEDCVLEHSPGGCSRVMPASTGDMEQLEAPSHTGGVFCAP